MQSTVTRIDVCVNDCVSYYDCVAKLLLSNSKMDLVDTRCKQFGIIPNWVRASMKVFQQTGVCSYNYRSFNIVSSD